MSVDVDLYGIHFLGDGLFEGYEFIEFIGIDGLAFAFFEVIALVAEKIKVLEYISNRTAVSFHYLVYLIKL